MKLSVLCYGSYVKYSVDAMKFTPHACLGTVAKALN
jgi:hypothetical protein